MSVWYLFVLIQTAIADEFELNRKYSEQDWNEGATPTVNSYSYRCFLQWFYPVINSFLSKTTAEREAFACAAQEGSKFSVVSLLPGTVLGPHLGFFLDDRYSLTRHRWSYFIFPQLFVEFHSREEQSRCHRLSFVLIFVGVINLSFAISDVRFENIRLHALMCSISRDVARFHIAAMEQSSAEGRYICANTAVSLQKILQVNCSYDALCWSHSTDCSRKLCRYECCEETGERALLLTLSHSV